MAEICGGGTGHHGTVRCFFEIVSHSGETVPDVEINGIFRQIMQITTPEYR